MWTKKKRISLRAAIDQLWCKRKKKHWKKQSRWMTKLCVFQCQSWHWSFVWFFSDFWFCPLIFAKKNRRLRLVRVFFSIIFSFREETSVKNLILPTYNNNKKHWIKRKRNACKSKTLKGLYQQPKQKWKEEKTLPAPNVYDYNDVWCVCVCVCERNFVKLQKQCQWKERNKNEKKRGLVWFDVRVWLKNQKPKKKRKGNCSMFAHLHSFSKTFIRLVFFLSFVCPRIIQ